MAILDTDTTNGWIREACPPVVVCPGTAGYALDDNDIYSIGTGMFSTGVEFAQLVSPSYSRAIPTSHIRAGGAQSHPSAPLSHVSGASSPTIFGKPSLYLVNNSVTDIIQYPNDTPIPSASDWTMSLWWNMPTDSAGYIVFSLVRISTNAVEVYNSTTTTWQGTNINMRTGTWKYIRVVRSGATVKLYVDGLFVANLSTNYSAGSAISGSAQQYFTSGKGVYIRDFLVARVARNGLFLPTNVLGY